MTLAELADSLPNGFHDSALKRLAIDYEQQAARLEMSLLVGVPDDPTADRNACRDALVEVLGLQFLIISAPDIGECLSSAGKVCIVDAYETREILSYCKEINPTLLQSLPSDVFAFSFYVSDWNSYMHVAGRDCNMQWTGNNHAHNGDSRQPSLPGEKIDLK